MPHFRASVPPIPTKAPTRVAPLRDEVAAGPKPLCPSPYTGPESGEEIDRQKVEPSLLRYLNERAVFDVLRNHGPMTRAELTRRIPVSAPTVGKAVSNLLRAGLLEERDGASPDAEPERRGRSGRPGRIVGVAREGVQVLGATIDVRRCSVVTADLDGRIDEACVLEFETPSSYDAIIDGLVKRARKLMSRPGVRTLGLGVSAPGEIDHTSGRVLLSSNLPIVDGTSPRNELQQRLGIETVMVHDTEAACLAEQAWGAACGMNDFAIVVVLEGFGASFVTGGRLLRGRSQMAGELGHVTVDLHGRLCGCGNRGCLETMATDTAFARRVSERLGRPMEVEQLIAAVQRGELDVSAELEVTLEYLAVGLSAVVNIFNPEAVLVCSRMLDADEGAFERLKLLTQQRALGPLINGCRIVRAEGDNRAGAVAAMIQHLTRSLGPVLPRDIDAAVR